MSCGNKLVNLYNGKVMGWDFIYITLLTPLFLTSSVSLFYFILVISLLDCLGKYSCMSSTFNIAIPNGDRFL